MPTIGRRVLTALLLTSFLLAACAIQPAVPAPAAESGAADTTAYPTTTINIMAPASPGGGWDSTARAMATALTASSGQNAQVYNVPGAGGTVGLAQFVNDHAGDPHQLMVGGMVMVGVIKTNAAPVGLDQVTPIASLTTEWKAIAVAADSPYETFVQLAEAFKTAAIGSFVACTISTVTALVGRSLLRGMLSLFLGLLIGLMGIDVLTGQARFTFGIPKLLDGIDVVVVAVGIFAVGKALFVASRLRHEKEEIIPVRGGIGMTGEEWRRSWPAWLRGTLIGFPFGALPAGGVEIPTFLSYTTEKRLSKHKAEWGNGAIKGVAGPMCPDGSPAYAADNRRGDWSLAKATKINVKIHVASNDTSHLHWLFASFVSFDAKNSHRNGRCRWTLTCYLLPLRPPTLPPLPNPGTVQALPRHFRPSVDIGHWRRHCR